MQATGTERRKSARRKSFLTQGSVKITPRGKGSDLEFQADVKDASDIGLGVEAAVQLHLGEPVAVTGVLVCGLTRTTLESRTATVIRCKSIREGRYSIGLAYRPAADAADDKAEASAADHYETMQLSPKADTETIHRVYRLLAQRYHPDNLDTGDQAHFKAVLEAYRVLSDPEKRAAYDAGLPQRRALRWKIFDQASAAQGKEGERRKRAGVLSLLYAQRMNQPHQAGMSIHEIEELLGCPREHLEFALWYLKEAGCVARTDNGRYAITIQGVDRSEAAEETVMPASKLLSAARGRG